MVPCSTFNAVRLWLPCTKFLNCNLPGRALLGFAQSLFYIRFGNLKRNGFKSPIVAPCHSHRSYKKRSRRLIIWLLLGFVFNVSPKFYIVDVKSEKITPTKIQQKFATVPAPKLQRKAKATSLLPPAPHSTFDAARLWLPCTTFSICNLHGRTLLGLAQSI